MKKIILSVLTLCSFGLVAQSPILVKDINVTGNSSDAKYFYEFNGKMYFNAYNYAKGYELWSYDDSQSLGDQIEMIADIDPGTGDSDPRNFIEFNGKLCFTADNNNGIELYEYDGVNPPTMVADINPGSGGSAPSKLTVYNSKLFFFANDAAGDRELWEYDGTNPPQLTYNLNASGSAFGNPSNMIVHENKLYLTGTDGSNNGYYGVYEFNDTVAAPTLVPNSGGTNIASGKNPGQLFSAHGNVYFSKSGGTTTAAVLWKYDMTTSTMVTQNQTYPGSYATINNKLIYRANESGFGYELFEYDGTNTPTMVADINVGASSSNPNTFTENNGTLYFIADNGVDGSELYKYDGTNTPAIVADFNPGAASSNIYNIGSYNNNIVFSGIDGTLVYDYELAVYDDTNPPAYIAESADINPGNQSSIQFDSYEIEFDGNFYFFAHDGVSTKVWKYDGVTASTFADLGDLTYGSFDVLNNELYIGARGGLWKTDGIAAPTQLETMPCKSLRTFNSKLYFNGYVATSGEELWEHDGTSSSLVYDLATGTTGFRPENLTVVGSRLYFTNGLGTNSDKIFSYDGTNPPIQLPSPTAYDEAYNLTSFGNKLYFTSNQATQFGQQSRLWSVSGNSAPTVAISDLYGCYDLGVYNNQLVYDGFILSGMTPGPTQLFFYSGSGSGTGISINGYQQARYFTQSGNDLYFRAGDGTGYELWKYTGTGLPEQLTYLGTQGAAALPINLYDFNGKLMFYAVSNNIGRELYTLCETDLSTTVSGTVITASESGATYQWVDCDNGDAPITGETNQSFTATSNGNYACMIDNGNCNAKTTCETINITFSNIDKKDNLKLTIYPNPTQNTLNIVSNDDIVNYEIISNLGNVVYTGTEAQISVAGFANGIYYLKLNTENSVSVKKFIKQ